MIGDKRTRTGGFKIHIQVVCLKLEEKEEEKKNESRGKGSGKWY